MKILPNLLTVDPDRANLPLHSGIVVTRPSPESDNTSDGRHQWLWPAHPLGFIFIVKIDRFNTRDRVA